MIILPFPHVHFIVVVLGGRERKRELSEISRQPIQALLTKYK